MSDTNWQPRYRVTATGPCDIVYLSGATPQEFKESGIQPQEDDRLPTPEELAAWDGKRFHEPEDVFSRDYLDNDDTSELGLAGGFLRFEYHETDNTVWAFVEFTGSRELNEKEQELLKFDLEVQFGDGLGDSLFQQHDLSGVHLPAAKSMQVNTSPIRLSDLPDVSEIKLGMTRQQIRGILGEPVSVRHKYRIYRHPPVFVYDRFELHFDYPAAGGLFRVYTEDADGVSIVLLEDRMYGQSRKDRRGCHSTPSTR